MTDRDLAVAGLLLSLLALSLIALMLVGAATWSHFAAAVRAVPDLPALGG